MTQQARSTGQSASGREPLVLALGEAIPQIDPTAFLAPGCSVIGDAHVGPQASVWYGATVRADRTTITIGARSNLQDNATLHADPGFPCTVGNDVTIGHNAVVHGCTVHDHVIVGMGAVVMNGATIGEDCLLAGGTVVPEGTEIPPGSLVAGVPGKVRRQLTEEDKARLRQGPQTYIEMSAKHRAALED